MTCSDGPERPQFHGRRRGKKLRRRRSDLLETLLPRFRVPVPQAGESVDPKALFGSAITDIWFEVGFGNGEHLVAQASQNPGVGLIGCEPYLNGVSALLTHIVDECIESIRIFPDDARLLMSALPEASIGRCFVLFNDPWPKWRHRDRRFIGPGTLDQLARLLRPGAELRLASDDPVLIRWMLEHCWHHPRFEWAARRPIDWRERPGDWPATRYEAKAIDAGRRPVFLRFLRKNDGLDYGTPSRAAR